MKNAKKELIDHIGNRDVIYVSITHGASYTRSEKIEGVLDFVLPKLDFDYDHSYGAQRLFGTVWYSDGTWSERGEYDGSEWWEHRQCPPLPYIAGSVCWTKAQAIKDAIQHK